MNLHELLKEKRHEQKLTQEQLAEKIYVSNKTISNWETGKTSPDLDSLIRLARLFHLSLDHVLLEGSDIVENIKKIEAAKLARRYYWICWGTNLMFLLTLVTQHFLSSESLFGPLFLLGAIIFNGITMRHFFYSVRSTHNERTPLQLLRLPYKLVFILVVGCLALIILFFVSSL